MGFTVLIAEDDENDALLLKRALKKASIKASVHIVPDGQEAISYMKGEGLYSDRNTYHFPRVLITDLKMPRKSGFEVLQWLRQNPECNVVPVIVLSSSKESVDVARCYQLGANAYFAKPSRIDDLVKLININLEFWLLAEIPVASPDKKCI